MFKSHVLGLIYLIFGGVLFGQIEIQAISEPQLHLWSSDQYYLYEFYLANPGPDADIEIRLKSHQEASILKVGLGNTQIDSLAFGERICQGEKLLVRLFFKHIPGRVKEDSIEIILETNQIQKNICFTYQIVKEEDKLVKLFQTNFTKYLILDMDYGSIKELVLYSKDRSRFEHIKSRSRFLDLSFLENGAYILEINNEEYIINKK